MARRIAADGTPVGGEFQVSASQGGTSSNSVVGANEAGQFAVVWDSRGSTLDRSGPGILGRVYSADGTPLSGEFRINATIAVNQRGPSIAWLSTWRFVVTWRGAGNGTATSVFARVFDVSGRAVTNEIRVPQTQSVGLSESLFVVLPSGGFQIAWSGRVAGGASQIFSRRFDATGRPLGPEFRVTTTRAWNSSPVIALDGDQLIIAWQAVGDARDRSGTGVLARRYTLGRAALGGAFLVNQSTLGSQSDPSVDSLSNGGYVVAWRGRGVGDTVGIFLREFDADGSPRGGEQKANTTTSGTQARPNVRSIGAMYYAVTWDGNVAGDRQGVALTTVQAGIPLPDAKVKLLNQVFFIGDAEHPAPPVKIITFYNNTDRMIYPVLENANAAEDPNVAGTSLYDPLDPFNQEYRSYIGYSDSQGSDWLVLQL